MRAALPLLIPFALVVGGCGAKAQTIGGEPRRSAPPKVVSLSPSTSEIVASNLDARMLVGRTQSDNFPQNVMAVPVVASVKPDFEKIKASGASVLVYDADLYSPDDIKRIEGMGLKSIGFKAHTIAGFEKELYLLAGELGSETGVNDYVNRIEQARTESAGDPVQGNPKVAVVLGNGEYVAGTDSFVADVVKTCGATPVGPASDKFDAFSPEAAVAAAPDVIVLATTKDTSAKDAAALKTNPRFANSPAVKNGRVQAINEDVVLRRGSRVNTLISTMHKLIALGQSANQ